MTMIHMNKQFFFFGTVTQLNKNGTRMMMTIMRLLEYLSMLDLDRNGGGKTTASVVAGPHLTTHHGDNSHICGALFGGPFSK